MKNVLKAFGIIAFVAVIGFSMAACGGGDDSGGGGDDSGGGENETPVLTLTFEEISNWNDPDKQDWNRWQVFYQDESKTFNLSDALSKNKVYVFTYSFTSNVDIDAITARFINKKPDGSEWKDDIADYKELTTDVKKNKKISGKVTLSPKSGASGLLKENIYLNILIHNRNVSTPATLTFYKFSLELEGNGNSIVNDTFNSLDDFKNWLNGQPDNSAGNPYNVKLNLPNLSGLKDFLKGLPGKFVNLDFSGSTFTSIEDFAFDGYTNLISIILPSGITSIGKGAFMNCTNLTSINIPNSVKSIGMNAFYSCVKLTNITIPNGVTSIEGQTFHNCSSLTSITIPSSVTSISFTGFNGCTNLTSVTFNGTIPEANFGNTYQSPFDGDLRAKYLASGTGTYTTTAPVGSSSVWTKQGGGGGTDLASFAGTWNASGNRSIVFSGSSFTYKVNGTTTYSGTFSFSGSTITFNATGLGTASGGFSLSGTTLTLSNHTWDSSVNGTYTKQ